MKNLYTAKAISVGGRHGHVETDDKKLAFECTPFNSPTGTNPEQLFACGYAACFSSALEGAAKLEKIAVSDIEVTVGIGLNEDAQGYFLSASIEVMLAGLEKQAAQSLMAKAHQLCPYSKATRGNIHVTLSVNGEMFSPQA